MEFYEDEEVLEKRRKNKKRIKIVLIVIAVIFLLFLIIYKFLVPVDYWHFNEKRIKFVENKYKISLDNAKPERYWEPSLSRDIISRFDFHTDDYKKFMEGFHGESIVRSQELKNGKKAKYKCHVEGNYYFDIEFTKEEDGYSGKLTYYSDTSNVNYGSTEQPSTKYGYTANKNY